MGRRKLSPLESSNRKTVRLATKALKNKPTWKPTPGYKYLKDLEPGAVFITQNKMKGVLINCFVNAKVIIMDVPSARPEDKDYYLGKHTIAENTEVKEVL